MDAETRAEIAALRAEISELKLTRAHKILRAVKRNRRIVASLAAIAIVIPVSMYALSITKSFTFTAGNPTVASEVNANFDQLYAKVNDLAAYHPPVGSIIAWHKSLSGTPSLPGTGEWVECNGQTLSDPQSAAYNGQVIPNLNGDPAGANSPGQSAKIAMFLRGGMTSGTGQADAFQGWQLGATADDVGVRDYFSRALARDNAVSQIIASNYTNIFMNTGYQGGANAVKAVSDGTNGTPRTANETRPVNMSVVWIMKVK